MPSDVDLHLLGPLEGKRVLDLGCGEGQTLVDLVERGAVVIGVDPSSDRLARARRVCEAADAKVELHQAELAELAFVRADSIDAALSIGVLAEVENLDRVFRQVHRVLKPEAPLVFSLSHPVWRMLGPAEGDGVGLAARRSYFDAEAQTVSGLFTSLTRAKLRVDTLLEPVSDITPMAPTTLVVRARKEGT